VPTFVSDSTRLSPNTSGRVRAIGTPGTPRLWLSEIDAQLAAGDGGITKTLEKCEVAASDGFSFRDK